MYTSEQILTAERKVFKLLGCNANVPHEESYWRAIATASGLFDRYYTIGMNLLFVLSLRGSDFLPSVVATAVASSVARVYQVSYVNHFSVTEEVIEGCAAEVVSSCSAIRRSRLKAYENLGHKRDKEAWLAAFNSVCDAKLPENKDAAPPREYSRSSYFVADISLDLLAPPKSWIIAPVLGEGGFGSVRKVEYQDHTYAVKKLSRSDTKSEGIDYRFCREVSIMQSLDHPGIAKMRHITFDLKSIYMDLGISDLEEWIGRNGPAGKETQVQLAVEMFSALEYMHSEGCLHRDIKPGNILVFADRFVLTDFGGGRGCQIPLRDNYFTAGVCAIHYRSPEVLLGSLTYNDELDVWSMLCTLYECATGKVLFEGGVFSEVRQVHEIFSVLGTPTEETWPDIMMLRDYSPSSYPSVIKAKEAFFSGDDRLSDCYKEMLTKGMIMNPARRPNSGEVLEIISKYTP